MRYLLAAAVLLAACRPAVPHEEPACVFVPSISLTVPRCASWPHATVACPGAPDVMPRCDDAGVLSCRAPSGAALPGVSPVCAWDNVDAGVGGADY